MKGRWKVCDMYQQRHVHNMTRRNVTFRQGKYQCTHRDCMLDERRMLRDYSIALL